MTPAHDRAALRQHTPTKLRLPGRARSTRTAVAACALGATLLAGCGPDDPGTGPGALPAPVSRDLKKQTNAEQRTWDAPSPAQARKTRTFLKGERGRLLGRFAAHSRTVEARVTEKAVTQRCRTLARDWEKRFPGKKLRDAVTHSPDQPLADTSMRQLNALMGLLDRCDHGDAERARDSARIAHAWSDLYQRRAEQGGVTP